MFQHYLTTLLSRMVANKVVAEYTKSQQEDLGVLRPPKFCFVFGIASMVFWAGAMVAVLLSTEETLDIVLCGIVFGILFALGLFLVLYERNYMVLYRDHEITYRSFFRITRRYHCQDIESACYTDQGGLKICFKDGRKLRFSREEQYFYSDIVKQEKLKCAFEGEESAIIHVYLHPILMGICWLMCGCLVLGSFRYLVLFPYAILLFAACLALQLSGTTYDKESRILTRRRCGFSKKYDMHAHSAAPLYKNGFLMKVEISEGNRRVASVPVSREYKNGIRLARALCGARKV